MTSHSFLCMTHLCSFNCFQICSLSLYQSNFKKFGNGDYLHFFLLAFINLFGSIGSSFILNLGKVYPFFSSLFLSLLLTPFSETPIVCKHFTREINILFDSFLSHFWIICIRMLFFLCCVIC
jgi:hypothetical protein